MWGLVTNCQGCKDPRWNMHKNAALNVSWSPGRITSEMLTCMVASQGYQTPSGNGTWGLLVIAWDTQSPLTACQLVLWEPTHGRRSRGRPHAMYIDTLKRDTGLNTVAEIRTLMEDICMEDREQWRAEVKMSWVGVYLAARPEWLFMIFKTKNLTIPITHKILRYTAIPITHKNLRPIPITHKNLRPIPITHKTPKPPSNRQCWWLRASGNGDNSYLMSPT